MPIENNIQAEVPWLELKTNSEDWQQADPRLLGSMLASMVLIRTFEEKVLVLAGEGLVHGPAHSAIGQEGGAVGAMTAMRSSDTINGSHRAHHQFLAKSLQFIQPEGMPVTGDFDSGVATLVRRSLAEIMGLAEGFCKGRGGSMHLRWAEAGNLGTNAIVGGGVPFAAGSAWAHRHAGTGDAAFTFFGDGAVNIGSVLETMNLAAAWSLPICFFIENNGYAVSTTVAESTAEPRLSSRGAAFGIPAWKVDGMDPLAVHMATRKALGHMRAGKGPAIIEAEVYRYFHQSGPFPGSAFGYRSKQEEQEWQARDPIDLVAAKMTERGLLTEADRSDLVARCQQLLDETIAALVEEDAGKRRIRPALWPSADFRDFGIRGDLSEFDGARFCEIEQFDGELKDQRFVDVVADVMRHRMERDSSVVVMGEDVHRLKGGTNGATRGLHELFPDRVLGTPISENAFVGLAGGMAVDGRYVPVVEFMYPDFMWVAADQVFNQIAKARHMFGGDDEVPLVLRTKIAMGTGYGSQHSMDPAGIFATSVGWRIVAPSTPYDYVGLMNSALRCKDPVLVIEHVDLYGSRGAAPIDDLDYCIPLGKAKTVRHGNAMTVLTYLAMVQPVLDEVEKLGVDADVIDLRSLDRAGIDWAAIEESIARTGNVLIVEQGSVGTSIGGYLAGEIQQRCFDLLDAPVLRVHGGEASPSVSKVLEAAACADRAEVAAGLRKLLKERSIELLEAC